ncbi:hypothetical protein [Paenibacillus sophorae]|uniref:hypothetical protein n=1 Tax=Paenibacillus sophorae TaxID=1333845 RepID=UPI0004BBDA1F|nr:hypothetical protein [Paenibacillus sophorae]
MNVFSFISYLYAKLKPVPHVICICDFGGIRGVFLDMTFVVYDAAGQIATTFEYGDTGMGEGR